MAKAQHELWADKIRFTKSLCGGVIFCAYTQAQALVCEKVGAKAIIAVQNPLTPAEEEEGVEADTTDPGNMCSIMDCVPLPVFAQIRIGHEIEAHIMQEIGANGIHEFYSMFDADDDDDDDLDDDIDPVVQDKGKGKSKEKPKKKADPVDVPDIAIPKRKFAVPFICGVENLGEAIKCISEGASMLHTNGDPKNIAVAIGVLRSIQKDIKALVSIKGDIGKLDEAAKKIGVKPGFVHQVAKDGKLPVPLFGCGGVKNPSDAAFLKATGCDGIIVGTQVLESLDAQRRAYGIVLATQNPKNYKMLAGISNKLGVQ